MVIKTIDQLQSGDRVLHLGEVWEVQGASKPRGRMNGVRLRGVGRSVRGIGAELHRAPEVCAGFAIAT